MAKNIIMRYIYKPLWCLYKWDFQEDNFVYAAWQPSTPHITIKLGSNACSKLLCRNAPPNYGEANTGQIEQINFDITQCLTIAYSASTTPILKTRMRNIHTERVNCYSCSAIHHCLLLLSVLSVCGPPRMWNFQVLKKCNSVKFFVGLWSLAICVVFTVVSTSKVHLARLR